MLKFEKLSPDECAIVVDQLIDLIRQQVSLQEKKGILIGLSGGIDSALAIALYIAACAVITLIATALMTDYTGKDISEEYQLR